MNIRIATPSDASAITKIQIDNWKYAYKTIFPEEFLEDLNYKHKIIQNKLWLENLEDTTRVYSAENDSQVIIGFAVGGLERENTPEFSGELWGLYVSNNHQRRGIRTQLLGKIVQYLLDLNFSSMLVWILKGNPYRAFYEKFDGKIIAEKQKDFNGLKRPIFAYGWSDLQQLNNLISLQ
ncbi:MAG: putative Uncharacterized N-acetyltransferase YuaI [Promethearchaeota archaeon]|jgi:L-amino acid N-acyltransferase YncA|nr:MAG: putative Uncharacterized N-acetyltransferase YuaI [Candidatus Lokiarchaeota archaeon]